MGSHEPTKGAGLAGRQRVSGPAIGRGVLVAVCLVVLGLIGVGAALAALKPPRLDKTFSGDGIATTRFSGSRFDSFSGVAETSRRKIVAAGSSGGRAHVVRFLTRGRLDETFGGDGQVAPRFQGRPLGPARDVLVDRLDRIVVLATSDGGAALIRLRPNGRPDRSFSGDGFAALPASSAVSPTELAFGKRGRIVMVGLVGGIPSPEVYIGCYRPDGRLDRTFSGDGYRVIHVGKSQSSRSVAVDRRGRIVIGAGAPAGNGQRRSWAFTVIRLRPGGRFDSTFSGDGRATVDPTSIGDEFTDLTIDGEGRIVAVGRTLALPDVAVRLLADGRRDPSFGTDGRSLRVISVPVNVSVDDRRRIVISGWEEYDYSSQNAAVMKLGPDGRGARSATVRAMFAFGDHFLDRRGRIVVGGVDLAQGRRGREVPESVGRSGETAVLPATGPRTVCRTGKGGEDGRAPIGAGN